MPKYRTIVADPPWPQGQTGIGLTRGFAHAIPDVREIPLPYPTMTMADIAALPVRDLADSDAHLYLWATSKFLEQSFAVVRAWGFQVSATLVWCKQPLGLPIGGAFGSSVEFVQFCRRGSLPAKAWVPTRWFQWSRRRGAPVSMGHRRVTGHSAKPEAFLDMVEQVSPGPYLELFARRNRLGWDTWGDEALEMVELF